MEDCPFDPNGAQCHDEDCPYVNTAETKAQQGKKSRGDANGRKTNAADAGRAAKSTGTDEQPWATRAHRSARTGLPAAVGHVAWRTNAAQRLRTPTNNKKPAERLNEDQLTIVQDILSKGLSETQLEYVRIATAPTDMVQDGGLRPMTQLEERVFEAYFKGELPIDALPAFTNATLPCAARLLLMDAHEREIEGALIANVPAGVQLGKRASYRTIVCQLIDSYSSDGTDRADLDEFVRCSVRMDYDAGTRVLTVTMKSQELAKAWDGVRFRAQSGLLSFVFDEPAARKTEKVYSKARPARLYKLLISARQILERPTSTTGSRSCWTRRCCRSSEGPTA